MTEEFYHKNIFGEVVDTDLQLEEEDEKPVLDRKGREFNIFTLTDAFGARKKRDAWVIYQKALAEGVSPEEVFYKIIWQIKSMLLASKTNNVGETDMKQFPYSKAKGYAMNFKPGEIEKLSENLIIEFAKARHGEGEVETIIEKTLLSL